MKRELILRPYQEDPAKFVEETDRTVLAIAPNGGKTEISIYSIGVYLRANPLARVLVLTHSTTVLLDNFWNRIEELNVDFTYSRDFEESANVHLCLPHSEKRISGEYDYVIIDEAHENYLATRVQRILKNVKPKKELLLTGTPSKFIAAGDYDISAIAANEIPEEYFAKLNLELVASDYDWKDHYNSDDEVKSSYGFTYENTKNTLDSVLDKLIHRLQTGFNAEQFNHPSLVTKFKSWAFTYNEIGKTMIVCNRVEQADMVYEILNDHGVNVAVSHGECDGDSDRIVNFKEGFHDVLVVVRRANLGYNDEELMNIIDISGTHNPNIIYQMFCRVTRGTPDMNKYYMKLTPKNSINMALTEMSVCAGLMLTDRKYLMEYNGKNFRNFKVPVLKKGLKTEGESKTRVRRGNGQDFMFPDFTHDVINVLKDVLHDLNNPVSIYKMTTIGHVKHQLGYSSKRPPLTYEDLLDSAKGNLEYAE